MPADPGVAVIVAGAPPHTVEADTVTVGSGFTNTLIAVVPVHPFVPVIVIVPV